MRSSQPTPQAKEALFDVLFEARKIVDANEEELPNDPDHGPTSRRRSPMRSTKRIDFSDSDDEDAERWAREVEYEDGMKAGAALMGSRTQPVEPTGFRSYDESVRSPKPEVKSMAGTPPTVPKPAERNGKAEQQQRQDAASTAVKTAFLDDDDEDEVAVDGWKKQPQADVSGEEADQGEDNPRRQLSFPIKMDTPSSIRQPSPRQATPPPSSTRQPSPRQITPSPPPRQITPRPMDRRQPSPALPLEPQTPPKPALKPPARQVEVQKKPAVGGSRWRKLHRSKREAVLSSDSDDDRVDDSGVRAVMRTPPRKLVDKVQSRYARAERRLDDAESVRAVQRSPPKRHDHYTVAQTRTRVVYSSDDDDEYENNRMDDFIAREKASHADFPAPKENRARAATPEYRRDRRIARSRSPGAGSARGSGRSTSPVRCASPGRRGTQRAERVVLWIAHHGETEDPLHSAWGQTAQHLDNTKRRMVQADPPLSYVGVQQAMELGKFMQDEGVDKVLASPYLSTLQTAQHAAWPLGRRVAVEPGLVQPKHCPHHLPPLTKRLNYVPSLDLSHLPWSSEPAGEEEALDALPRVLDVSMSLAQAMCGGDRTMLVTHPATALALVAALTANQRRGPITEATKVHMVDVLEREEVVRAAGVYKVERGPSGLWQSDYKCYNFFLSKQTAAPHPWRSLLAGLSHTEWLNVWEDLVNRYASRRIQVPRVAARVGAAAAVPAAAPDSRSETPPSRSASRAARISFADDDDDDDDDVFVRPRSRASRSRIPPSSPLKTRAWSPQRYEARTRKLRCG